MSAQAWLLDSQQLWPPATFATMRDWSGCTRLTTVGSAYARFTSSLRANCGVWPVALWQPPQRLLALMFSQKLILEGLHVGRGWRGTRVAGRRGRRRGRG